MEISIKQRLLQFLSYKNIGQNKFEKMVGLSNGYIKALRHSPSYEKIQMIIRSFPELNEGWLLTGEGEMLQSEIQQQELNDDRQELLDMQRELIALQREKIAMLTEKVAELTEKISEFEKKMSVQTQKVA